MSKEIISKHQSIMSKIKDTLQDFDDSNADIEIAEKKELGTDEPYDDGQGRKYDILDEELE